MIPMPELFFYAEAEGLLEDSPLRFPEVEIDSFNTPYISHDIFYNLSYDEQNTLFREYPNLYIV